MIPFLVILLVQTPTIANLPATGMSVDVLRPHFTIGETSLLSVAVFASGRTRLGRARLYFELPYFRLDPSGGGSATSTLGNAYLGIEFGDHEGLGGSAGVRLPLASPDANARFGSFVDVSRFEAFLPKQLTLQGKVRYRGQNANGVFVDVSEGPALWLPNDRNTYGELVMHHQLSAGHRGSSIWFAAGLSGQTILTATRAEVGELTIWELDASIGSSRGSIRPAVHLLLPLDEEYRASMDFIVGVGVAFFLPTTTR